MANPYDLHADVDLQQARDSRYLVVDHVESSMATDISRYFYQLVNHPAPLRALVRLAVAHLEVVPYEFRVKTSALKRPHYGYCVYQAASLAQKLGVERISALELGVAGGAGLVDLEYHAAHVKRITGVTVDIYGFDTGVGLPPPEDYRDLPYQWRKAFFVMDEAKLRARLKHARLVLGNVKDTCARFFDDFDPAPVGCILHDLDYYSSTRDSFQLFDASQEGFLPRVFNYFDDVVGDDISLYSEHTGVRLAIREFNEQHSQKKLSQQVHLSARHDRQKWHEKIFIYHDFAHPRYCDFVASEDQQLDIGRTLG